MKSGSEKGYTKNLLLAATIISLSTTMPMNVAYANPTPTNGANASYTITAGTESNYNFKTTDGTNTQYWLINLTADKLNGQHVTFSSSNNGGTAINIALPNGKTQTLYYTYTRPTAPVNYDIVQNPTKDLGTIAAEGSWSVRPDPKSVYGVTNNESGSTISIENKTYQNNKLTASTNDRNVERLEYKYLTLNAGNVHNEGTIESITADFINNQVELNISNDNPAVEDNKNWHLCTYLHGGAIYNASNIGNITGDFIGNSVKINQTYEGVEHYADTAITRGGAIYTQGGSTIGNITGDFINNSAGSQGGAIYNFRGTIGNITGNAIGNSASEGGFIYNKGGGKNNKDAIIGDITGNIENNTGSAIYNEYGKIGNITGDFINNTSGYYGGVINNKTGEIKDITGDFINNTGTSGGAIANLQDYDTEGKIGNIHSNFISNTADKGGAIYNDATIESISGNFIENYYEGSSSPQGGALYTDGTLGDINADFIGNYAKSTSSSGTAKGGAIYAGGTVGDISGDFIGNYVSSNSHLNEGYGGAIYVSAGEIGKKTDDEFTGTAISGNFINNSAVTGGGAIAISGYNAAVGDIAANFTNNTVYNDEDVWYGAHNVQGGAISIDNSYSSVKSITGNFTNNSAKSLSGAAYGGAIYNVGSLGTIKGNFSNNSVEANPYYENAKYNNTYALGGAIDSTADITLTDSSFTNNSAVSKNSSGTPISYSYGGAIYMSGGNLVINAVDSDVNFEGNSAYNGGAIYNNNSSKTITMNALNKDITFTNNNRTGLEDGFGF